MTVDAQVDEARRLLAGALHVAPEEIADDAAIGSVEAWDSIAHVNLMMAVEERLGRTLDPLETIEAASMPGLAKLLAGR